MGSGRFTQVDPFVGVLELPGTQHPYAYGLNNPLRYGDPSGEVFVESVVGGAVVGAAFGGIGYVINNPGQSLGAYVKNVEFWRAVGVGAVSGAAAGAVAALAVSGLGLLGLKAATAGASALIGAISGALAGGAGQVVSNVLTCQKWYHNLGWAMLGGAVFGGVMGFAGWHLSRWWQSYRQATGCFVAGTQVATPEGNVAIEDIHVGDEVLSTDAGGNLVIGEVTDAFTHTVGILVDLTLRDAGGAVYTITGTPEHPFYVPAVGDYVPMGDLSVGTGLRAVDGSAVVVVGIAVRHGTFTVYNFTVAEWHNYFVTAEGGGWGS